MNTVLIAEDEKMIRQGIRTMILRSGVPVNSVIECGNGEAALEILREQKIDVLFTDIRMPKMDGIELVSRIKELPDMPLTVVISGYDDFSYAIQMMRNGAREYLLKPIEREQITAVMRKLEEELKEKRGREKQIENLELQQLRYVLLHGSREELSDKYMPVRILPEQFIVCCYEEKQIYPEPKGAVLLGEMGQYTVLIADAGQIADLLNKELRSCHVGVSGAYRGIENLQRAYHEAMQARQEAFSLGARIVYFGEKTEEETGSPDVDGMEKIAHMLSTDKMEEALYRLERMAADTRRRKNSGALFAENIAVLVQKIQQIYQGTLKKEEYELTRLSELYRYPCISEFVEALSAWCIEFNKKMNTEYDNYAVKKKMQQALAYIQEHYAGDLNMAMVSNYISMNYSLFSNTFKQYTGNNFVTYLKNLRIREARRLLEETDLRVGQIGQMVGYENEKHFMKIFKSMCGVTPTEFRKNTAYKE